MIITITTTSIIPLLCFLPFDASVVDELGVNCLQTALASQCNVFPRSRTGGEGLLGSGLCSRALRPRVYSPCSQQPCSGGAGFCPQHPNPEKKKKKKKKKKNETHPTFTASQQTGIPETSAWPLHTLSAQIKGCRLWHALRSLLTLASQA
ncbi:unnamed protein product [Lota lota]